MNHQHILTASSRMLYDGSWVKYLVGHMGHGSLEVTHRLPWLTYFQNSLTIRLGNNFAIRPSYISSRTLSTSLHYLVKPPLATARAASCNVRVHLFVCLSVCLFVCLSVAKLQKHDFLKN